MNSTLVAVLVFVFVFGAALVGLAIRVPASHQDGETKDLLKLVMGLVSTITALVLSLLIASAHGSYSTQENEVQQLGAQIVQLDGLFAHYGPEASGCRAQLRRMVQAELARLWPDAAATQGAAHASQIYSPAEDLFATVADLTPKSEAQRSAQARALQLMTSTGTTIRLLYLQAGGSVSWPFFVMLVLWIVMLFVGYGLFATNNATAISALFAGALTVACAIFLILEMNQPFGGMMKLSSVPIESALAQIGH